jgi:hypothetical protein
MTVLRHVVNTRDITNASPKTCFLRHVVNTRDITNDSHKTCCKYKGHN